MTKENNLQSFSNGEINLPVRALANGNIEFDAEKAAIGLGIVSKSGGYENVRWSRVNDYLNSATNGRKVAKGDFISEPQFYKLAIKANNETAEKFQNWVTSDVLPSIRKHGAYMTPETIEKTITDPDFIIKLATQLKTEREGRLMAEQRVDELQPKATYYDTVLASSDLVTITTIAKDYGYSAQELNKKLHELGVQYKQSSMWLLYKDYSKLGWTQSQTHVVHKGDGNNKTVMNTKWTQKGRLGIYELLKQNNVLPLIESDNQAA